MSDVLLSWVAKEAGLRVDPSSVAQDFANGFLWGQLLGALHMQPDADKFENRNTPDAMIGNYTRLQPTFKRLGVAMNSRVANSLMREEAGVALRLLYSIKQSLGQKDPEKYKHSGRLGQSGHTLLDGLPSRSTFGRQQDTQQPGQRFFEETMRSSRAPTTGKHLMESMYLRRFAEKQYKLEASSAAALDAERQAYTAKRSTFHEQVHERMSSMRLDKTKQLERDAAVHASLMRRKEDVEREELRVELALAEASRRRKAEQVQLAAQDVALGIDTFEINMKRLLKGDDDGDEHLTPATTHSPLEHQAKMRELATSPTRLLEDMAGYMNGVHAQRVDDLATKREREARRRRMLVEQQAAAHEAERKAEAEALLQELARTVAEEQQVAAQLWQTAQDKEASRAVRELRERQYAERRAQEWDETLRRELEQHQTTREQYHAQKAHEMTLWSEAQQVRAAEKQARHLALCERMAWQLVQLAERAAEHRQRTGQLVPRNDWRRWLAMFVANDPALGDPVVKQAHADALQQQADGALARAAVADWLDCLGEFHQPGLAPVSRNEPLGELLGTLAAAARADSSSSDAQPPPGVTAAVRELPLKLSVIGGPLSGKSSVAHALARQYKLRVIDPGALLQAATAAAKAHVAAQQPDLAAADGAAPAPPSRQVQLGLAIQAALDAGQAPPDEALVELVVRAMEETPTWTPPPEPAAPPEANAKGGAKGAKPPPPPKPAGKGAAAAPAEQPPSPPQGFVLDGFPASLRQAQLLETALTGLDLQAEQAVLDSASRVAPPPAAMMPQPGRVLRSGLDAVLALSGPTDPEQALKRAQGRRLDPETGRVYHVEFAPAPAEDAALAARLKETWAPVTDPLTGASMDVAAVQQRLQAGAGALAALNEWCRRFGRLRRPVDGSGGAADVAAAAGDAAGSVLRARAAAAACGVVAEAAGRAAVAAARAKEAAGGAAAHAEAAALDLLLAKKAEVQAQEMVDEAAAAAAGEAGGKGAAAGKGNKKGDAGAESPAAQVLGVQAAARCAESLKACRGAAGEATDQAQRASAAAAAAAAALERARLSLGDAELCAAAEAEAKQCVADAEAAQAAAVDAAARAEAAMQASQAACQEALRLLEQSRPPTAASTTPTSTQPADAAPPASAIPSRSSTPESTPPTQPPADPDAPSAAEAAPPQPQEPEPAPQPVPFKPPVAAALTRQWQGLEQAYLSGLEQSLCALVARHEAATSQFARVKQQFKELLAAPDERAALVANFAKAFNAALLAATQSGPSPPPSAASTSTAPRRSGKALGTARRTGSVSGAAAAAEGPGPGSSPEELKAWLNTRAEALREAVWALCDRKLELAEAERARVAGDGFVHEHAAALEQRYRALAQAELERAHATVAFICASVPAKYGGGAAAAAVRAAPNVASARPQPELQQAAQRLKASGAMPQALVDVAARCPTLAAALQQAFAAYAAAAAAAKDGLSLVRAASSAAPSPEPPADADASGLEAAAGEGAPASSSTEGGDDAPPAAARRPSPEAVAAAVAAEAAKLMAQEAAILEARLALLARRAAAAVEGLGQLKDATLRTLAAWTKARYAAECTAAAALDKAVRQAVEAGEKLPEDLKLADDGTVPVAEEDAALPREALAYPPARPAERPPPSAALTVPQLSALVGKMQALAPSGFVSVPAMAQVLCEAAADGGLAEQWRGATAAAVEAALRLLDPTETGHVDWRHVLVCLVGTTFPVVLQATCADMADQAEMLLEADKDKDGLLAESEWMGVEVWFQYRAVQPAAADENLDSEEARAAAKQAALERAAGLKKVLWDALSCVAPEGSPAAGTPRLDLHAVLLYLCADRDHFAGVKKACSVAAHSIASNARVDAAALHRMAYPLGAEALRALQRSPMDADALAQLVEEEWQARGGSGGGAAAAAAPAAPAGPTPPAPPSAAPPAQAGAPPDAGAAQPAAPTPVISAEQLAYGVRGGRVVSQLLQRYHWHDLLAATKHAAHCAPSST